MKCIDFQRALHADPRHLPHEARQHAQQCTECARRMVKQLNFDASLDMALQVPAPDGMEDRILLATRFSDKKRMTLYAVAASVLMAVIVTLSMPLMTAKTELDIALEHVLAEPEHLAETNTVSPAQLNALLARVGARTETMLPVSYANVCDLPNGEGGHIVLITQHGRVTLVLMPSGASGTMERKVIKGMIAELYPAPRGNYSLIASNDAALTEAKSILASQFRWL